MKKIEIIMIDINATKRFTNFEKKIMKKYINKHLEEEKTIININVKKSLRTFKKTR